ncbi:unnamed protein product [Rhizophagus irregularis]|uniref:Uncharacterized protein n=1 Tax=Rhizophagus irregularis TaxID=588596 RepID=A0A2N1MTB7_9GLOM|nr:hypothetical protein RhiirC2_786945 [Rhizophagus irregularis]CAB4389066.1 unnamed protein product [Rhizophagus irregularis]
MDETSRVNAMKVQWASNIALTQNIASILWEIVPIRHHHWKRYVDKGLPNEVCRLVLMHPLSFVDQESVSHLLLVNDLPYDSRDPKEFTEFTDYMESVAEFGFNHIIIIGEIDYGMVFMDCYSLLFQYVPKIVAK